MKKFIKLFRFNANSQYKMRHMIKALLHDLDLATESQYNKNLVCVRLKEIIK